MVEKPLCYFNNQPLFIKSTCEFPTLPKFLLFSRLLASSLIFRALTRSSPLHQQSLTSPTRSSQALYQQALTTLTWNTPLHHRAPELIQSNLVITATLLLQKKVPLLIRSCAKTIRSMASAIISVLAKISALDSREKIAIKHLSLQGQANTAIHRPLLNNSTSLMNFIWTTTTVIMLALARAGPAGFARHSSPERLCALLRNALGLPGSVRRSFKLSEAQVSQLYPVCIM